MRFAYAGWYFMNLSPQGLALIRSFEGFSATPYLCPAGKWTVGYGHVLVTPPEKIPPLPISMQQAEALLLKDVSLAENAIHRFVKSPITQPQFDALTSFIYNIGIAAFSRSRLLKLLNAGKNTEAAEEFCRWVYVNGKRSKGLERRRKAERAMFLAQK
jgi:lysozyme